MNDLEEGKKKSKGEKEERRGRESCFNLFVSNQSDVTHLLLLLL